jgi:hypothetical protein
VEEAHVTELTGLLREGSMRAGRYWMHLSRFFTITAN